MSDELQQYTCPECGSVGADSKVDMDKFPHYKGPLCHLPGCDYKIRMKKSHNGKIIDDAVEEPKEDNKTFYEKYPELAKERAAMEAGSQLIGGFLDWVQEQEDLKGITQLREYCIEDHPLSKHSCEEDPQDCDIEKTEDGITIHQLLHRYFEIDSVKLENEKQAMLDEFTKQRDEKNATGS